MKVFPVHHVPCRECGKIVARKSYWRNPSCNVCTKKRARAHHEGEIQRLREQARRYRILLAIGPYQTWEELLRAVRIRKPRGWATNFAIAIEKRRRAA